jgi:hypothetical protein
MKDAMDDIFENRAPRPSAMVGCVKMASAKSHVGVAGQHRRLRSGHDVIAGEQSVLLSQRPTCSAAYASLGKVERTLAMKI